MRLPLWVECIFYLIIRNENQARRFIKAVKERSRDPAWWLMFLYNFGNHPKAEELAVQALIDLGPGAAPGVFKHFPVGIKPKEKFTLLAAVVGRYGNEALQPLAALVQNRVTAFPAAIALARLGDAGADILIDALGRRGKTTRRACALGLGMGLCRRPDRAVPALINALRDSKDRPTQLHLILALEDYGDKRAVPCPRELLRKHKRSDWRVARGALVGLGGIGPGATDAFPDLKACFSDSRLMSKAMMAACQVAIGDSKLIMDLYHCCGDETPLLKGRFIYSLGHAVARAREAAQSTVDRLRELNDPEADICAMWIDSFLNVKVVEIAKEGKLVNE